MKKYSIHLFLGILVSLLAASSFNWIINPYDLFVSPEISGLNTYKIEIERYTRLSKIYQMDRIKPDVIFLGSSRGLVVPDEYLSNNGMLPFNLSLASASTYELLRVLQHAQAIKPLKRVILALDESFSDNVQPNFSEKRLAVNPDGSVNRTRWIMKWKDNFSSLLSLSALRSSFRTIRKQKDNPDTTDLSQYKAKRVLQAGGHRQMFRTMEASIFANFNGLENVCERSLSMTAGMAVSAKHAEIFQQIVEFSYMNNIELFVYLPPVHARYYEAKCIVGQWSEMEMMKRSIVDIVTKIAKKYHAVPLKVWDFSGYNVITTENVPRGGDKSGKMNWYWEGSHYTRETSKLIFDKILSDKEGTYEDFGVKINTENIEEHLANIRRNRKTYLKSHAEDVVEVNLLFDDISR